MNNKNLIILNQDILSVNFLQVTGHFWLICYLTYKLFVNFNYDQVYVTEIDLFVLSTASTLDY